MEQEIESEMEWQRLKSSPSSTIHEAINRWLHTDMEYVVAVGDIIPFMYIHNWGSCVQVLIYPKMTLLEALSGPMGPKMRTATFRHKIWRYVVPAWKLRPRKVTDTLFWERVG